MGASEALDSLPLVDLGNGSPILLLHGGGGPHSVIAFAERLSEHARVLLPTHPGFVGSPYIQQVETVADVANLYVALLGMLGLSRVTVVGVSIGGWIACEIALLAPDRLAGIVLVDSVGLQVAGEDVLDVFSIPRESLAGLAFHRPEQFMTDPNTQTLHQKEAMATNFAALGHYGRSQRMQDPTLGPRLAALDIPTLVLWGESDRVVSPTYGRAFAAAIPGARFALIKEAGHFPQIEQPGQLVAQVVAELPSERPRDGA